MEKSKLLSLTVNQDSSDVNKEDDPEVSSITGSVTGTEKLHLSTRHITPQVFINQQEQFTQHHFTYIELKMFNESADTSRTISRVSEVLSINQKLVFRLTNDIAGE